MWCFNLATLVVSIMIIYPLFGIYEKRVAYYCLRRISDKIFPYGRIKWRNLGSARDILNAHISPPTYRSNPDVKVLGAIYVHMRCPFANPRFRRGYPNKQRSPLGLSPCLYIRHFVNTTFKPSFVTQYFPRGRARSIPGNRHFNF